MLLFKGASREVSGLAFSPDGGTLAACPFNRIEFWNLAAGTVSAIEGLPFFGVPQDNLRFDPTGRWLLAALGQSGYLVNVANQTGVHIDKGFAGHIISVSSSGWVLIDTGRIAAFRLTGKGLSDRKWDRQVGTEILGMDYFPDGKRFVSLEDRVGANNRLRIRLATDGAVVGDSILDCDRGGACKGGAG